MSEELERLEAANEAKVNALTAMGVDRVILTLGAISVRISVIWDVLGLSGQQRPVPADGPEAIYEETLSTYLDDLHASITKPRLLTPNDARR